MSVPRVLMKAPLQALLAWPSFRRRAIYELRQRYYTELANRIPLGHGLVCPLAFPDAWSSFAEIFVQREYDAVFDHMRLPDRWIDLGCHAGYFSLYVAWRRAQMGLRGPGRALLVDADSRVAPAVVELLRRNALEEAFRFLPGAIADGDGVREFRQRSCMSSSIAVAGDDDGLATDVPTLTASALLEAFEPPYNLIKVDVEGGEYAFVTAYGDVIDAADAVLVEWHSWHDGGGGVAQIREALSARGLGRPVVVCAAKPVAEGPLAGAETGLDLFLR